jgi:hypothetical protein
MAFQCVLEKYVLEKSGRTAKACWRLRIMEWIAVMVSQKRIPTM